MNPSYNLPLPGPAFQMIRIRDLLLKEYGDQGADTIDRLVAQVEYTAYQCIRMLDPDEGIESVLAEWLEDVVVIRRGIHELGQVKTRDESQGSWTTADVLPILCALYHRRGGFTGPCRFSFISDAGADNRPQRAGSYGPLFGLKNLLELQAAGQQLSESEREELQGYRERILPRIAEVLREKHGEKIDLAAAEELLDSTTIETQSHVLRRPPDLTELDEALRRHLPNAPVYGAWQLERFHERLLMHIIKKVRRGLNADERRIRIVDVLACAAPTPVPEDLPDLDDLPGATPLEKKTLYGGFDPTEMPVLRRQRAHSAERLRRLRDLGLTDDLDAFTTAVLDLQNRIRRQVCATEPAVEDVGPATLEALRGRLAPLAADHLPAYVRLDENTCVGVLWIETAACTIYWHGFRRRDAA